MIDFTIDDVCECLSYWLDVPIIAKIDEKTKTITSWAVFNKNFSLGKPCLYISTEIFEEQKTIIDSALWIMQFDVTMSIWKENKYDT